MTRPVGEQVIVISGASSGIGRDCAHGPFDEVAKSSSAWTAARLALGRVGSMAVLAGAAAGAVIGYDGITKRG